MRKHRIWSRIWSLRADVVFLLLMPLIGLVYLLQPQRGLAWQDSWRKIAEFRGNLQSDTFVLLEPLAPDQVNGAALAHFGSNIEFVGCDAAVTRKGQKDQVWHLTWWRAREPMTADYVLVTEFIPADGRAPIQVEHRLGQQFLTDEVSTSQWRAKQAVMDALPLPAEIDPNGDYHIRIKVLPARGGNALDVDTPVLDVDDQGWLLICQ